MVNSRARRILKWAVPSVLAVVIVAYLLVSYLIAAGVTKAEIKAPQDDPGRHGRTFEDVQFPSRQEGIVLRGWYLPAPNAVRTLIFVHGISSERTGDGAVDLASRLVPRGFNVLLFDLRAHGASGKGRISGGYYERKDVLGAVDYVASRGISPESIGLVGFSMGAATIIMSAAEEPRIHTLVADSPFANASELIAHETARKTPVPRAVVPVFLPASRLIARMLYGINLNALSPEKAVKKLDYPVFIIHGDADTRVPLEHGERVYKAAKAGSTFWVVPGGDHVDAFRDHPDEYVERVTRYLDQQIPPGVRGPPSGPGPGGGP